jgi:hypothetical protein
MGALRDDTGFARCDMGAEGGSREVTSSASWGASAAAEFGRERAHFRPHAERLGWLISKEWFY